jgi:predicted nuclease of predicted toxin-antitoxin system
MKVLLDECTPLLLQRRLPECAISTVQECGWSGIKNGELLRRAEKEFDVFITSDQNLRFQQNLSGMRLAIIQLPTNQVPIVALLVPAVEGLLSSIRPGELVEVPLPQE